MFETENIDKHKILLVDDEPENIKIMYNALTPDLYSIIIASNGRIGIEQAIKHRPDAIIMDWDMPELDGLTATKAIRETPEIKDIPIIIVSGKMTSVENLKTALEAGTNDYIRKPFNAVEINARIKSIILLRDEQQRNLRLEKEIFQQKLENSKRELEMNQQSLTTLKAHLVHNSKYIDKILTDLQTIEPKANITVNRIIFGLISKLKVDIKRGSWNEFENHFEKIHPSFLENINKRFPDLTQNEIELCMFFKLNMTTHEMMTLTYKTDSTLKKARQRLKKKMGLCIEESLSNFITEIE